MNRAAKKIAVVGAGVLGRLVSLALAGRGYGVTLFDQGRTDTASLTAAGMLAPSCELEVASPLVQALAVDSLACWARIIADYGLDLFFQQNGTVVVAHALDERLLDEFALRIGRRLTGTFRSSISRLDRAGLSNIEPGLSNFRRALYFPVEGQIDTRQVVSQLGEAIRRSAVQFHDSIFVESVGAGEISIEGRRLDFNLVVDCRGVAASASLAGLRGVRGEVIEVFAPEVKLSRPVRLLHPRYPLYVVPRQDGRFVIGATQIESQDASPVTVQSALELLSALYSLDSGFAEANIIEMRAALRPAFADNEPRLIYQDGLVAVNGLYRHGYLLAPKVSELTVDFIDAFFNGRKLEQFPSESLLGQMVRLSQKQGEPLCK